MHQFIGIHMRCNSFAPLMRSADDGLQLSIAQLLLHGVVVGGKKSARGHDLNKIAAIFDLLAHGPRKEIRAVAHGASVRLQFG